MDSSFYWQLFVLSLICFMLYTLYALGRSSLSSDKKLLWCILILGFPLFGSIAYFVAARGS
ncbi:PLDc N-terminal domain-containing protein [Flavobacterium olei]|uniref:PLDc N-terminal domain-containing protein n=1 Tax=Flavobacterium olei TaxID=1886782 RepID=UPI00321BFA4B